MRQVKRALDPVSGRANFTERYGPSGHQVMVLARRLPGWPERIPRRQVCKEQAKNRRREGLDKEQKRRPCQ